MGLFRIFSLLKRSTTGTVICIENGNIAERRIFLRNVDQCYGLFTIMWISFRFFYCFTFVFFLFLLLLFFYCNIKSPPTIRRVFFGLVFSKTAQASNEVTVNMLTLCNKKVHDGQGKSVQGQTCLKTGIFFAGHFSQ